ncbi:anti-sigma factor family protein [Pseudonocardia xinjiangensis]|uniref:Putative zinc-finger domain-containing protein n=1 Tax=Pseudonocardia xinjiangensis TaxID=75289 RepID=A0ABX1RKX4_9PSEU|nr:zf-HC2 domain-containing protein [Pseudonocardia xinjiangensis]NMH81042.1 hypothetical protein [Pseudonocardia xinjiangensis]
MRLSDDHVDIDGYIVGGLDPDTARAVELHLAGCADCRDEVHSLREVQELLASVPVEAFLEGPPDDADLLLQRTLRQMRTDVSGTTGRRTRWAAAAGVVAAAAALCVGVLVGRTMADVPQVLADGPTPTSASPQVPGTRFASAQDPTTGARLTVRMVPAAGWVRVNAAVTGIPAGQACQLIVVGRDGQRQTAGSWLVSSSTAAQGVTLDGTVLLDPAAVTQVLVQNTSGHRFVTANV